MTKGIVNSASKFALLGGTAVALALTMSTPASAASMVDRGLGKRVSDLEAEVRLLKNRVKALEDRKLSVPDKIVVSGNSRVKVTLYGQVNKAVVARFDRRGTEIQPGWDNDSSSSRLGFLARGRISPDIVVSANLEWDFRGVARTTSTRGNGFVNNGIRGRQSWISFTHADLGTLLVGQTTLGSFATYADLSGTSIVSESSGWGDEFYITGGNAFGFNYATAQGFIIPPARTAQLIYSTPRIAGFQGKVSWETGDSLGLQANYVGSPFAGVRVMAAFGYRYVGSRNGFAGANTTSYDGSISALHVPTGLSLTFASGTNVNRNAASANNPYFWYVKAGWQTKMLSMGKTYFSVDYGRYDHMNGTGDTHSNNIGVAVVQGIDSAAMDLYAAYHYGRGKNVGVRQPDAHAIIIGSRIKF
jgi:hypothetical protein